MANINDEIKFPKVSVRYDGEVEMHNRQIIIDELNAIVAQLKAPPTPTKANETVEFGTNTSTALEIKFKWRKA